MRRRPWLAALPAGAMLAVVAVLVTRPGTDSAAGDQFPKAPATAQVSRTTLVDQEQVDGKLGYAGEISVTNQLAGTITKLAAKGQVVDRGQVLYEVDSRPARLLFGDRPSWRALGPGLTDGPDVRQLEDNLVALGHANSRNLTVDDIWTAATTEAVKRWQKAIGAEQTGALQFGEVVFAPGAVRVSEHPHAVGSAAQPGTEVVKATLSRQVVTVDLDARRQGLAKVGDAAAADRRNGRRVAANVGAVAKAADSGS